MLFPGWLVARDAKIRGAEAREVSIFSRGPVTELV
jgi:hypothetical protein